MKLTMKSTKKTVIPSKPFKRAKSEGEKQCYREAKQYDKHGKTVLPAKWPNVGPEGAVK